MLLYVAVGLELGAVVGSMLGSSDPSRRDSELGGNVAVSIGGINVGAPTSAGVELGWPLGASLKVRLGLKVKELETAVGAWVIGSKLEALLLGALLDKELGVILGIVLGKEVGVMLDNALGELLGTVLGKLLGLLLGVWLGAIMGTYGEALL